MNKKMVTIAVFLLFTLTLCSGCTQQQGTTTNKVNAGSTDSISLQTTGGLFSLLDDTVVVTAFEKSVSTPVDLTVEFIADPVHDSSLYVVSCYEFRPDGLIFDIPIQISIMYDVATLPVGLEETALQLYVNTGNNWELIQGSVVDQTSHTVTAQISHFSQIACASPAPETETAEDHDDSSSDPDADKDNTSALYWFKADTCFYNTKTPRIREGEHEDRYTVGVSAYWDPVPYVQYYQIKYVFNGNPPADYASSCDFREQGSSGCAREHVSIYEGTIYQRGGDPHNEHYCGSYDGPNKAIVSVKNHTTGENEQIVYGKLYPDGKHGFVYRVVYENIDDWEGLSETEIANIVNDMQEFLAEYVDGWEIWVRGVTERGD